MFRMLGIFLLPFFLSACGTAQKSESGLVEPSMLVIRAEKLIGVEITIGEFFSTLVQQSNLTPYKMGVLGVGDRENESLQAVTLEVKAGPSRVTVKDAGSVLFDKELYFNKGQTREIRIRR